MQNFDINYRRVGERSNSELATQWNALAPARDSQIRSGLDISFHNVLMPGIMKFLGDRRYRRMLDAGCGTGVLTSFLASKSENVDGVDISDKSISIAQRYNSSNNIRFINNSIEDHSERVGGKYDAVVANMVLMDVSNLKRVVRAIYSLLKPGGVFVFSMTNPIFWASYYGYAEEPWFRYEEEIFVEGPFVISSDRASNSKISIGISTHVHRPISMYVNAFADANFLKLMLEEPVPSREIQDLYPRAWNGPRYIIGKAVAGPKVRFI